MDVWGASLCCDECLHLTSRAKHHKTIRLEYHHVARGFDTCSFVMDRFETHFVAVVRFSSEPHGPVSPSLAALSHKTVRSHHWLNGVTASYYDNRHGIISGSGEQDAPTSVRPLYHC